MSASTGPADVRVIARLPKVTDLETHVRVIRVDGKVAIELRDYVVSTGTYVGGYWIPASQTSVESLQDALSEALIAIRRMREELSDRW